MFFFVYSFTVHLENSTLLHFNMAVWLIGPIALMVGYDVQYVFGLVTSYLVWYGVTIGTRF